MKKLFVLFIIGLWFPAILLAETPQAHIEQLAVQFKDAFNAGDGAAVASLYSEDAVVFPPGADRIDGRPGIQAFWQGAIDAGMTLTDLHPVEIDAQGDTAIEVGAFILNIPGEAGSTDAHGQYIVVWKRTGHTWQLHRDIWNIK